MAHRGSARPAGEAFADPSDLVAALVASDGTDLIRQVV